MPALPVAYDAATDRRYVIVRHLFSGRRRNTEHHAWLQQQFSTCFPELTLLYLSLDTAVDEILGGLCPANGWKLVFATCRLDGRGRSDLGASMWKMEPFTTPRSSWTSPSVATTFTPPQPLLGGAAIVLQRASPTTMWHAPLFPWTAGWSCSMWPWGVFYDRASCRTWQPEVCLCQSGHGGACRPSRAYFLPVAIWIYRGQAHGILHCQSTSSTRTWWTQASWKQGLAGKLATGEFRTAQAKEYPAQLRKALAFSSLREFQTKLGGARLISPADISVGPESSCSQQKQL